MGEIRGFMIQDTAHEHTLVDLPNLLEDMMLRSINLK